MAWFRQNSPFILALLLIFGGLAYAQKAKFQSGYDQPVVNQGYSSAAITPSDTVKIAPTRAIYNGNSSSCSIVMQLVGDTGPQTWQNVQPGAYLTVQAVLVKVATQCSNLIAVY